MRSEDARDASENERMAVLEVYQSAEAADFRWFVPGGPRPDGRGRREAPGEGPQRLAPVFGARHQNFEAQRKKLRCALRSHTLPSPIRERV